jgi:hypothetical protein
MRMDDPPLSKSVPGGSFTRNPTDRWNCRQATVVSFIAAGIMGVSAAAAANASSFLGTPPWLETPKGWEAVLAPPDEPGGRFVMEGRLLGPGGKSGMPGVKMFVYHADRDGLYAKENGLYMRLAGVLLTDAQGRYRVISALPGQYGGPPHVHFEAWGPGLPLRTWFVNLYRGPKEKPDSLWGRMGVRYRPLRTYPYLDEFRHRVAPEADVMRVARGVFHTRCDLYWDGGFEASAHDDSTRRGLVTD